MIALLTILIIIALFVLFITGNKAPTTPAKRPLWLEKYTYTYQKSDISCKMVPSYPNSPTVINYCSGSLTVVGPATNEAKKYEIVSTTHLYQNGVPLPLDRLNKFTPGKTKLAVSFFDKDQKTVSRISFQ